MATQIKTQKDHKFESFLNNDGIDQMKPAPKKVVSAMSLSDQWAGSMNRLSSFDRTRSECAESPSALTNLLSKRCKKTIIDHPRVSSYAFAFDIDGVILNGPNTIPCAKKAIRMLNGENKYHIMVPYIFVTNGGGKPESARAKDLSKRLDCEINVEQIIQGHTPMKSLAVKYQNVLVVGGVGDTCRKIAEGYGFRNVYIPLDIMYWNPSVSPYYDLSDEEKKICKKGVDFSKTKIDAILVFADSRNWAVDEQIILELLLSKGGYMGTKSETNNEGPQLFFAHSDFIWSTDYKLSRYGMGALQVTIAALYKESTGKELKVTRFGKPQRGTFKYAKSVLSKWRGDVLKEYFEILAEVPEGDSEEDIQKKITQTVRRGSTSSRHALFQESESDSDSESDTSSRSDEGLTFEALSSLESHMPQCSSVYFVGDTPESDIRFANAHDESWYSILVKTGVYKDGTVPKYKPKHICENVLDAVNFAIEKEAQKELNEWNATVENDDSIGGSESD